MSDLKNLKAIVISILERNEYARNSDSYLYLQVLRYMDGRLLDMPVCKFLSDMKELKVPPFESVRRTRQKAQAENPHLCAGQVVQGFRSDNEKTYREFARS